MTFSSLSRHVKVTSDFSPGTFTGTNRVSYPFYSLLIFSLLLFSWHPSPRGDLHPRAQASDRLAVPSRVLPPPPPSLFVSLSPSQIHIALYQHPAKHLIQLWLAARSAAAAPTCDRSAPCWDPAAGFLTSFGYRRGAEEQGRRGRGRRGEGVGVTTIS